MKKIFNIFVLVCVFASLFLIGCAVKKQDTTLKPVTIETPDVEQHIKENPVVEKENETIPVSHEDIKKSMKDAKQFCGDNVCENMESFYPTEKLVCDVMKCTINNVYTENSYICPGDCGLQCNESVNIGLTPGSCKFSGGDLVVNIKNSGRDKISGLLFYIASSREGDIKTQIGYGTSEIEIDAGTTKEVSIEISNWKEKFGTVHHVQIVPRQKVDGQIKECSNKKVYLPLTSCRP